MNSQNSYESRYYREAGTVRSFRTSASVIGRWSRSRGFNSGNKGKQISDYVNWYFDRSGVKEYLGNPNPSNDVKIGVTTTRQMTDYDFFGNKKGFSSAFYGASIDFLVGEQGVAEVGVGNNRNLGVGVNLDTGGVVGGSLHIGLSFPPSFGYGSVSTPSE